MAAYVKENGGWHTIQLNSKFTAPLSCQPMLCYLAFFLLLLSPYFPMLCYFIFTTNICYYLSLSLSLFTAFEPWLLARLDMRQDSHSQEQSAVSAAQSHESERTRASKACCFCWCCCCSCSWWATHALYRGEEITVTWLLVLFSQMIGYIAQFHTLIVCFFKQFLELIRLFSKSHFMILFTDFHSKSRFMILLFSK